MRLSPLLLACLFALGAGRASGPQIRDHTGLETLLGPGSCPVTGYTSATESVNLAIPDGDTSGVWVGPISFSPVPGEIITDVVVELDIEHTWVGDLTVRVQHTSSGGPVDTVDLLNRPNNGDCFGDLVSGSTDYSFGTDLSLVPIGDLDCPEMIPEGCYAVALESGLNALEVFRGRPPGDGEWSLFLSDAAVSDVGTLHAWTVHLLSAPQVTVCPLDSDGPTGVQVTVPFLLSHETDPLHAFTLDVGYDSTYLSYRSIARSGFTQPWDFLSVGVLSSDSLRVGGLSALPLSAADPDTLFYLTFDIDPAAVGTALLGTGNYTSDLEGAADCWGEVTFVPPVGVFPATDVPALASLTVSPNPFQDAVKLRYRIPDGPTRSVRLRVYNIQGQLVRSLLDGSRPPGAYDLAWLGDDEHGGLVAAGTYFSVIEWAGCRATRKIIKAH